MAEPLLLGVQTECEAAFIVAPGSNQAFNAAGMISPAAERTHIEGVAVQRLNAPVHHDA